MLTYRQINAYELVIGTVIPVKGTVRTINRSVFGMIVITTDTHTVRYDDFMAITIVAN
jgi:hypothetical protein